MKNSMSPFSQVLKMSVTKSVLFLLVTLSYNCGITGDLLAPVSEKLIKSSDEIFNFEELLDSQLEVPTLDTEIAKIIADGGLEKYTAGLDNDNKDLNTPQMIQKHNRISEEHYVKTKDKYRLTLFRIPSKHKKRKVVFLMHGFLCSSDDWLTVGPKKALPFLLADQGYEVWLGNARGNKYSRHHEHLPTSSAKFWDFTWHEIGYYDLPAMIDYVLQVTGQQKLYYVGHSQGTTAFFVMCSERPEYNDKFALMIAMSPIAWMSHLIGPLRLLAPLRNLLNVVLSKLHVYEFKPHNGLMRLLSKKICGSTELASLICNQVLFLITGFSYSQLNVENLPVIFGHLPGGGSKNELIHYLQEIDSGKFRRYDHGEVKNLAVYGCKNPPDYPVDKVTAPVAIFCSNGDWLSSLIDVNILARKLNVVDWYEVSTVEKHFCHTDYIYGKDVKKLVYNRLLKLIKKY